MTHWVLCVCVCQQTWKGKWLIVARRICPVDCELALWWMTEVSTHTREWKCDVSTFELPCTTVIDSLPVSNYDSKVPMIRLSVTSLNCYQRSLDWPFSLWLTLRYVLFTRKREKKSHSKRKKSVTTRFPCFLDTYQITRLADPPHPMSKCPVV